MKLFRLNCYGGHLSVSKETKSICLFFIHRYIDSEIFAADMLISGYVDLSIDATLLHRGGWKKLCVATSVCLKFFC